MRSREGSALTRRLFHLVVATLALLPGVASGQACTGSASFTAGSYQMSAGAAFNDKATSVSAGLAVGGPRPFGQFTVGRTTFDGVEGSALGIEGALGVQLPLGEARLLQLCPLASVTVSSGPSGVDVYGDGSLLVDYSETDLSFGLAIGGMASQSGTTQVIPSGSLAFVSARVNVRGGIYGDTESGTESFGLLGLGVGFVFNKKITLHPAVAIPFGLDGASSSFGVSVGVNFGQRSSAP